MTARNREAPAGRPARWPIVAVVIVMVLTIVVRARLLSIPLERDEGEYAYAGQLVLQGIPPYQSVYNMKLPGIYYAYAMVLAVFGQTETGVHLGLLVVNVATILLVFLLGRRLFDAPAGAGAAAAFAVMSVSLSVEGLFAHATHFVLLPALGGLLLLLRALESGRRRLMIGSGVLLGTAVLMKQHGVVFLIFAALFVAWTRLRSKPRDRRRFMIELTALGAGAVIPLVGVCVALLASGALGRVWLWSVSYASQYVSQRGWSDALTYLVRGVRNAVGTTWPLWGLSVIGLVALARDETWRRSRTFVLGLALLSFLSTVPGFYFRPHYFVLLLPAIALLAGAAPAATARLVSRWGGEGRARVACATVFAVALIGAFALDSDRLLRMSPKRLMREVYNQNPFPEAKQVADYLKARTSPDEAIAVFGSEPEIFFYAGRRSATGYVYMYPLTETHQLAATMREEMFREIEAARPRYAVFVGVNTSWADHSPSDRSALERALAYSQANYEPVGMVEILSPELTEARWEGELQGYVPKSPYRLVVLKRR